MKIKRLYTIAISILVFASCDNDEEYLPDDSHNDNRNWSANTVASRIEMPHTNAAFLLVPHYATVNGKQVLNYTLQWNAAMRHSSWVAYSWDRTTAAEDKTVQRKDNFKWDVDIARTEGSVSKDDYTKNGYDKGHICASEDRVFCQEANDQTFYYSNMSPQFSPFNQGFWKELEAKVRSWGRATLPDSKGFCRYDTVYVVKGGTTNRLLCNYNGHIKASDGVIPMTDSNGYIPRTDGKMGLPVPMFYYMAVLSVKNGVYHAIAFLVPHSEDLTKTPKPKELQSYATTIDNLERVTGIDFFCNLTDRKETLAERVYSFTDWTW